MDLGNRLCAECRSNEAALFCTCSLPETCLCDACFPKHSRAVSRQGHHTWPIAVLQSYKNPRYFDRREAFPSVREQAQSALTDVEMAIGQLNARFGEIASTLNTLYYEKLGELQTFKDTLSREIPAALEEVEATLADDDPELKSQYGPVLRVLTEAPRAFRLFGYQIQIEDMRKLVTLAAFLIDPEKLIAEKYAAIGDGLITVYNVMSQDKQQFAAPDGLSGSSIVVDGKGLFCIGSNPASVNTYIVDLESLEVNARAALTAPRYASGVVKAGRRVFAFGGLDAFDRLLNSCEEWSAQSQQWTTIGNMQCGRAAFTPCSHKALIYLLSSWSTDHRSLESFNPATSSFSRLPLSLPSDFLCDCGSVTFIASSELIILTDKAQIARWKLEEGMDLKVGRVEKGCVSLQQPLVLGSQVIFACQGEIAIFSVEAARFL